MCEVTSGILVNFENGPMKLLLGDQVVFVLLCFPENCVSRSTKFCACARDPNKGG